MKEKWRSRPLAALALTLVLAAAVRIPGMAAQESIDTGRACSLSVTAGSEEFAADLAEADVVLDLYRIADAVKAENYDTYGYEMLEGYGNLQVSQNIDNEGWKALAQDAAAIALESGEPVVSGAPVTAAITRTDDGEALSCGLYLLIARSAGREDYQVTVKDEDGTELLATQALSRLHVYTFAPQLISLPAKEADADGVLNTANDGEWIYDAAVTLKPDQDIRYGSLEIVKTLRSYENGDPATFVFQVDAWTDADKTELLYSNVASLTFDAPGQRRTLLENAVPAGAYVEVTEVYGGSSYVLTSDELQTGVIDAEQVLSVAFENDYDEDRKGGYGIRNHFEYSEENGWSWQPETETE